MCAASGGSATLTKEKCAPEAAARELWLVLAGVNKVERAVPSSSHSPWTAETL